MDKGYGKWCNVSCWAILIGAYVAVGVWFGILSPRIDYVYQGYGAFDRDTAMAIASEHDENAAVVEGSGDTLVVAYNWTDREQGKYGLTAKEDRWAQYFTWAVWVGGVVFAGWWSWSHRGA